MRQKSVPEKEPATQVVKNIRRATRRHFSAEDKIRIVLEGLRGEDSIAELCRREGIVQNLYYRWSKDSRGGEEATCRRYGPGRDIG
jgi:transposase